ncbi:hypothetical protein BJY52DRAFT_1227991 [Lactarius psammicola]|nr:hypothetical protein BJY52DRAFT_1227991 [Lactarius psammicola]
MARFRDIVLNKEEGTVEIGAGLTWTDVYSYLVSKGLNVVGSRADGFGLTINTITAFELVLPNGHVKKVTEEDQDLWFALRAHGDLNGRIEQSLHAQGAVLVFERDQIESAYTAFAKWLSVYHDRRGALMGAITYSNGKSKQVGFRLVLFYDEPNPKCLYDELLNLPNSAKSITQGVLLRRRLDPLVPLGSLTLTCDANLGDELGEKAKDALTVSNLDAFESDIFTHGEPYAYPPDRSRTILPLSLLVVWDEKSLDKEQYVYDSVRSLSASITKAWMKDGQDLKDAARYTNYALYGTPLEKMYGKNVKMLREIEKKYNPFRVVDLTGVLSVDCNTGERIAHSRFYLSELSRHFM